MAFLEIRGATPISQEECLSMPEELREVTYQCTNRRCNHKQTLRFFLDDPPLPVTNCVACRAGFNMDMGEQIAHHVGMFPVADSMEAETIH
jgi:hypothetical protein